MHQRTRADQALTLPFRFGHDGGNHVGVPESGYWADAAKMCSRGSLAVQWGPGGVSEGCMELEASEPAEKGKRGRSADGDRKGGLMIEEKQQHPSIHPSMLHGVSQAPC